jgi:hypothetical protein
MSVATFGSFGFSGSEQAIQIEVRSEAFERVIEELKVLHSNDADKLRRLKN